MKSMMKEGTYRENAKIVKDIYAKDLDPAESRNLPLSICREFMQSHKEFQINLHGILDSRTAITNLKAKITSIVTALAANPAMLEGNAGEQGHILYVISGKGHHTRNAAKESGISPGVLKFKVAKLLRDYPGGLNFTENLLDGDFAILITKKTTP